MPLDKTKGHRFVSRSVAAGGGCYYEQDGHYYDFLGAEIPNPEAPQEAPAAEPLPFEEPVAEIAAEQAEEAVDASPAPATHRQPTKRKPPAKRKPNKKG